MAFSERRIGRILAFQALYSWNVGGVDVKDLLTFSWLENDTSCLYGKLQSQFEDFSDETKAEVFAFSRLLIQGVVDNIEEIDDLIKSHLSDNWQIDRINKVVLEVVRVGVYELLYQKDVDPAIVIDEAVEIVKDYADDDSHKFTNAILDGIKNTLIK